MSETPVVRVRGCELSYGDEVVLRSTDLEVAAGERVALRGPSGSGKTSLLLVLAGLVAPTAGAVEVVGTRVDGATAEDLARLRRRSVGIVFQFGELVPELTLIENVAIPLRLEGAKRRAAERAARDLLGEVGLADAAHRQPREVSGGQVQRAAIARALVLEPPLVLADEPTGALGPEHAELVEELLFAQAQARDAALVVATHAAEVAAAADRVVAIHHHVLVPG